MLELGVKAGRVVIDPKLAFWVLGNVPVTTKRKNAVGYVVFGRKNVTVLLSGKSSESAPPSDFQYSVFAIVDPLIQRSYVPTHAYTLNRYMFEAVMRTEKPVLVATGAS